MNTEQVKSRAADWLRRAPRISLEKEIYLTALQDAGVPQPCIDQIESLFYPESD